VLVWRQSQNLDAPRHDQKPFASHHRWQGLSPLSPSSTPRSAARAWIDCPAASSISLDHPQSSPCQGWDDRWITKKTSQIGCSIGTVFIPNRSRLRWPRSSSPTGLDLVLSATICSSFPPCYDLRYFSDSFYMITVLILDWWHVVRYFWTCFAAVIWWFQLYVLCSVRVNGRL
jgi:hypothetical protein